MTASLNKSTTTWARKNAEMRTLSRYWSLWQLHLSPSPSSYIQKPIAVAHQYLQQEFASTPAHLESFDNAPPHLPQLTTSLLDIFKDPHTSLHRRAQAGMCLRCYVSQPILKTCQGLKQQFGSHGQFTVRDLLSFVLNDDGKCLIVPGDDSQSQYVLDASETPRKSRFQIFAVEILQTFRSEVQSGMSLDSWARLQTRRAPNLINFLSEYGFKALSDWALLNRVGTTQLTWLSDADRLLVEAFHQIYRRDRCQRAQRSKCANPTPSQLQRMQQYMRGQDLVIEDPQQLISDLQRIATQLRSYEVWNSRIELDKYQFPADSLGQTGSEPRLDPIHIEQQELTEFFHAQLDRALSQVMIRELQAHTLKLRQSKAYAPFAEQWVSGLWLYYDQGLTLRQIASQLGMTSWDQARRILNPGKLLTRVRSQVVLRLLQQMLNKAERMGLTQLPPQPDYLQTLAEQVEGFVDTEIFQRAGEELRVGQNRSMDSPYAHRLRQILRSSFSAHCPVDHE